MSNLAIEAALGQERAVGQRHLFKRVMSQTEARVGDGAAVDRLSLSSEGYLYPRAGTTDRQQASEATEQRSLRVEVDQLVVNPMWLTGGSIAVSGLAGAVSPDYRVFTASPEGEPRFLHHLLRSQPYRDQYNLFVRANTTFDRRIQQQDLDQMPLWLPPRDEQRRIADFLDDRVARIDQIITARGSQVLAVEGLPWAGFSQAVSAARSEVMPLRRAISSLADGPFGSAFASNDYVEEGPAVIRLGNIGFAEFRATDLARVPESISRRFPGSQVRPGDLLVASLGDARNHAGRACIAPDDLGPAMVKGKCYVGRANDSVASAEFLAVLLSSPVAAEALVAQGSGATRSMLNFERLLSTVLPIPEKAAQQAITEDFTRTLADCNLQACRLRDSIQLLTEYKQSLITAAVTGKLDVATVGSDNSQVR